jgi:enamine deaminase RidA (YjgF/YER057c/UK114 family)
MSAEKSTTSAGGDARRTGGIVIGKTNLPPGAPPPQGDYVPATRYGQLITTAGMTSRVNGVAEMVGTIGDDLSEEDGRRAVRIAVENAADAVSSLLVPGESVTGFLRLTIYLVCSAGFTRHSAIADEASAYLRERWGTAAAGPRATIGVSTLPGGQPAEVQLTAIVERRVTNPTKSRQTQRST